MTAARWGRRDGRSPLVIAHRGASALELENTISAFRRARTDGADGVELDVMLCRSGEVVVFHDDDLERLAGRPERIADVALADLRAIRLERGGAIPLLDEVLEECGPLLVNVEIKAPQPLTRSMVLLVGRVADILARHAGANVLVSSFNPLALARLHALAPRVPTGLLFHRGQSRPLRQAWMRKVVRPSALHPDHLLVDERRLRRWHREGRAVNVWTVDHVTELRRLAALGVDGIITNDPAGSRAALMG